MNYSRNRATILAGGGVPPPAPVADFTGTPTTGVAPAFVSFTDTSTGSPTSWLWDFGDGQTSTQRNIFHQYDNPGTYTVTLTATNANGSSSKTRTGYVVLTTYAGSLAGYALGWEASHAYTDTARTTPAAANGDLVAALADQSGNGRHGTNATSGNRPVYRLLGGVIPAVYFPPGASKTLASASFFDSSWDTSFTAYFVKEYTGNAGPKILLGGNGTTMSVADDLDVGVGGKLDWYTNGNGSRYYGWTDGNVVGVCLRYDGINKRSEVWGLVGDGQVVSLADTAALGLTAGLTLGDLSQGGGFAWRGMFYAVYLYKAVHAVFTIHDFLQYLRDTLIQDPGSGSFFPSTTPGVIVCDGDSLTLGTGSTAGLTYPAQLGVLLGGATTVNAGVSGQTAGNMNEDAETDIDPHYINSNVLSLVCAWGGSEDMRAGWSPQIAFRRLYSYCTRRRARGWRVCVLTCLPRSDGGSDATFNTARGVFNQLILDNWADFADCVADVAADARIGDDGDEADGTYYAGDNLNLNNTGYGIVAAAVQAAIATIP